MHIPVDRAFVHNDMARKLMKTSTNLTDRPFAPGDLQCSVEKCTGNYADSTFVPAEPCIKLSILRL